MRKIPTLFERDPETHLVVDRVNYGGPMESGCEWVAEGHGVATRKWDGTACLWWDNRLWRRREIRRAFDSPEDLRDSGLEGRRWTEIPGLLEVPEFMCVGATWDMWSPGEEWRAAVKYQGWLPCDRSDPADRWHFEALPAGGIIFYNGQTYELVGPKVNGNPEDWTRHALIPHGDHVIPDAPRDFEGLRRYLEVQTQMEGIVFWMADGRRAKIKRRDFGLEWPVRRK